MSDGVRQLAGRGQPFGRADRIFRQLAVSDVGENDDLSARVAIVPYAVHGDANGALADYEFSAVTLRSVMAQGLVRA